MTVLIKKKVLFPSQKLSKCLILTNFLFLQVLRDCNNNFYLTTLIKSKSYFLDRIITLTEKHDNWLQLFV